MPAVLQVAAHSIASPFRDTNEDACFAIRARGLGLLGVADGMGGVPGGERASRAAVEACEAALRETDPRDGEASMRRAIAEASQAVARLSPEHGAEQGPGTTLLAAIVARNAAWLGNVGDCRAYRLRGDDWALLTRDHSLAAEAIQRGEWPAGEERAYRYRSVLTRVLGPGPDPEASRPDLRRVDLEPGDWLVLCSDGVWESLPEERLMALVTNSENAREAAEALVTGAAAGSSGDDATAVVARVH